MGFNRGELTHSLLPFISAYSVMKFALSRFNCNATVAGNTSTALVGDAYNRNSVCLFQILLLFVRDKGA